MSNPANDTTKPTLDEISRLVMPDARIAGYNMEPAKMARWLLNDYILTHTGKQVIAASGFYPHEIDDALAMRIDWCRREGLCG